MKKPSYYATPLRSRAAIVNWIESTFDRRYYDRKNWIICTDAKAHGVDLSFDHLLDVATKHGGITEVHKGDPIWESAARHRFDRDCSADALWEWGVEGARRTFTGRKGEHYGKPDDDGFNTLWNGTPVDVEYAFMGRSGGWLVLTHFEGYEMTGDVLDDLPFRTLYKLYRYLVMVNADLTRHNATARIEEAAAWDAFVNVIGDQLPTSAFVRKEEEERAHWEARDTVTVGVMDWDL